MKTQIILVCLMITSVLFSLISFVHKCYSFHDILYLYKDKIPLEVEALLSNDLGVPLLLARLLHNKLLQISVDVYSILLHYFDPFFVSTVVGLLGLICFGLGWWYILGNFRRYGLISLPFLVSITYEIFFHRSLMSGHIYFLAFSYVLISLFGGWQFARFHQSIKVIICFLILFVISILWSYFLPSELYRFCIQR